VAGAWAGHDCGSGATSTMKIRTLLAAGGVAAVAAATALAVPYVAGAANGPRAATAVPQGHSQPSPSNTSASGTANGPAAATAVQQTVSQPPSNTSVAPRQIPGVAGVVLARGASLQRNAALAPAVTPPPASSAAPATCTEPDCNVVYNGGPVQHTPHVYIIFWGPNWTTDTATKNYLTSFFTGLGNTSGGDTWSTTVDQYTDGTGHPAFGTSLLAGSWVDTSAPEALVTLADLGTEALKGITEFGITDVSDANVVVASQSGTCFAPPDSSDPAFTFAGNCGTPPGPTSQGYCGFHSDVLDGSSAYLPFTNLPYQTDAQSGCGENFVNSGSAGTDDGFSIVAGHEAMETITDPIVTGTKAQLAWIDLNDGVSGGEVADKCAWGGRIWGDNDPYGDVTLATGKFAVQSLWNNATESCVMTPLTVTAPATQSSTLGKAVSLQVKARTGTPAVLNYTASGLPAGLAINKTTGLISGTLNGVTAGTFTAKVTVAYYNISRTVSFSWKVGSATGQMKGFDSKCLGDYQAKTTPGTKIVIWTCEAGAAQNITFAANDELLVVGNCVTGTTTAFLQVCKGATSQEWTRLSNGEYVLKSNGECLTDPSATNGTQLTLAACKNTGNQRWALP